MNQSKIVWHSHYLPSTAIDNDDLLSRYPDSGKTADDIFAKTWISQRNYVSKEETTIDIATKAVAALLEAQNLQPWQIDKMIVGTFTWPYFAPTVSAAIMNELGINQGHGYDINAACPSYLTALARWHSDILLGNAENIIVVGADTMSKLLQQWKSWDYKTWVIFGDGAWATLLQSYSWLDDSGIQWVYERTYNDFNFDDRYSGTRMLNAAKIHTNLSVDMPEDWLLFNFNGLDIYVVCNKLVPEHIMTYLKENNLTTNDFDYIILHQANQRMLDVMSKSLWLEWTDKVISDIQYVWNTTSASIPVLLSRKMKAGEIKTWSRAILCSFGAWINISLVDTYL